MIKCDFSLWMPNWLIVFPHRCHDFSTFLPPLGVAAALLSSPAAGFGPIGPQHSLKCQMVSLTRENFSVWKKAIDRAERNLERERERLGETQRAAGPQITRKRKLNLEESAGLNKGMPKRRSDIRPEHQTWVRGKSTVQQGGRDAIRTDVWPSQNEQLVDSNDAFSIFILASFRFVADLTSSINFIWCVYSHDVYLSILIITVLYKKHQNTLEKRAQRRIKGKFK